MASDSRSGVSDWAEAEPTINPHAPWVYRQLTALWRVFIFSSIYMAVIGALKVVLTIYVLDLPMSLAPLAVGCLTFTIYAYDRLIDTSSDVVSNPRRTAFIQRHRRTLSALAALSYGIVIAIAVYKSPLALVLSLVPAVAWVLYAIDWTPDGLAAIDRLKEVFLLNTLLVAVTWAVTVVLFPLVFVGAELSPASLILIVYFAAGTFVGTELSNVRDVESDINNGISTLPAKFGLTSAKYVLHAISLFGIAFLGYGWTVGYFDVLSTIALSVGLLLMMAIIALVDRDVNKRRLSICGEFARTTSLLILVIATAL